MLHLFVQNMVWLINGNHHYDLSVKYMEDEKPFNREFTDTSFSYFKTIVIIMSFGRLIMFLVSLKWPNITKYFIYYQLT